MGTSGVPCRAIQGGILSPPREEGILGPPGVPSLRGGMLARAVVPTESRPGAPLTPDSPGVFLAPVMLFHALFLRIHRELCSHMERIWDNNVVAFRMVWNPGIRLVGLEGFPYF